MIFKANQDENKKSIVSPNQIYLATANNKSPKKHAHTSYNSPMCLDRADKTRASETSSSTHLFHYGKRSNDSR